jgi:hypothetical protein
VSPAVVPGAKDVQGRRPRRRGKRWQTPVSAPTSLAPSHPVGSDASLEPVTGADPEGLSSEKFAILAFLTWAKCYYVTFCL